MATEISETKILTKHKFKCRFDGSKFNSDQWCNNNKCQCECERRQ